MKNQLKEVPPDKESQDQTSLEKKPDVNIVYKQQHPMLKNFMRAMRKLTFEKIEKFFFKAALLIYFVFELIKFLWHEMSHW